MTREGTFNQLSLTRVDLDSQRLVRTAICEDCGIGDLNSKVDGLVQEIFEEDRDSFEENLVTSNEEEPETEITSEPEPNHRLLNSDLRSHNLHKLQFSPVFDCPNQLW